MPYPLFDELIHERTRLQLCGLLAAVVEAEFATLRDSLRVSDSALSKHLRTLDEAGYVTTRRHREEARTFTLVAMTEEGGTPSAAMSPRSSGSPVSRPWGKGVRCHAST